MHDRGLGPARRRHSFSLGRRAKRKVRPMSVHSLPRRADALPVPPLPVLEPYFQADRAAPAPVLRPLTALDRMYAYWGSDRA